MAFQEENTIICIDYRFVLKITPGTKVLKEWYSYPKVSMQISNQIKANYTDEDEK